MYSIRNYHPKDAEQLKQICIKTASPIFQGKKLTETALVEVYCRYYIEQLLVQQKSVYILLR